MPTAPLLPPDEMAKAQATAGINPAQFLIAAADLHNSGQLSAPSGPRDSKLGAPAPKPTKHLRANMKVVK